MREMDRSGAQDLASTSPIKPIDFVIVAAGLSAYYPLNGACRLCSSSPKGLSMSARELVKEGPIRVLRSP